MGEDGGGNDNCPVSTPVAGECRLVSHARLWSRWNGIAMRTGFRQPLDLTEVLSDAGK